MNARNGIVFGATLVFLSLPCIAQVTLEQRLSRAYELEKQGKASAAIADLRPLIDSRSLDSRGTGKAWNILALAYEDEGDLQQARRAYEESLRILKPLPDGRDYAMALDDFGRLCLATGQFEDAEVVRKKAFHLYEEYEDHAGMMRASLDLAAIAFREKKTHQGSKYLERAEAEARAATGLDDDDRAAMASLEAWLANYNHDFPLSVEKSRRALELWRNLHGDEHPYTGWGYLLLGDAEAAAGELDRAQNDVKQSIAILDRTVGRQNSRYLLARLAYARVLDAAGSHREAAQIRTATEPQLNAIYRTQCAGCTVSAMAFR